MDGQRFDADPGPDQIHQNDADPDSDPTTYSDTDPDPGFGYDPKIKLK